MPYYSELGIYTPSSSYTSPLLKGPYSTHSSILASNILPPSSKQFTRSNFRGFKPHLTPISESNLSAPLRRVSSPKVIYHSSPKVRVPRPIKINTADIDVSLNRFKRTPPKQPPVNQAPKTDATPPSPPPVEKEAKPNSEIRRDRATIRLQTIHKDTLEKEIGQIKSWRDNFKPEELVVEARRRKKSPGELLKEKFLIRSKSKDNVPLLPAPVIPRRSSVRKSPSFKDICNEITSDDAVEDLNPGQPLEVRRRQSRQLSHEDVIKEIQRSSSTLSVEEVQLLDALIQAESEVGLYDEPPEEPKKLKKRRGSKKKSAEDATVNKNSESATSSRLRKASSIKDMVKDISQVEIEMIPTKQKPIITGYIGSFDEKVKPNLKAVVGDLEVQESPKPEKKEKKFRFNVTVEEFPVKKTINAPKFSLTEENYAKNQMPLKRKPVITSILKKREVKCLGEESGNGLILQPKVVKKVVSEDVVKVEEKLVGEETQEDTKQKLLRSKSELQVQSTDQKELLKRSESMHSNFTVKVNRSEGNSVQLSGSPQGSGKLKILLIENSGEASKTDTSIPTSDEKKDIPEKTDKLLKSTKQSLKSDTFLCKADLGKRKDPPLWAKKPIKPVGESKEEVKVADVGGTQVSEQDCKTAEVKPTKEPNNILEKNQPKVSDQKQEVLKIVESPKVVSPAAINNHKPDLKSDESIEQLVQSKNVEKPQPKLEEKQVFKSLEPPKVVSPTKTSPPVAISKLTQDDKSNEPIEQFVKSKNVEKPQPKLEEKQVIKSLEPPKVVSPTKTSPPVAINKLTLDDKSNEPIEQFVKSKNIEEQAPKPCEAKKALQSVEPAKVESPTKTSPPAAKEVKNENFWELQNVEKYEPPKLGKLKLELKDPKTILKEIQDSRANVKEPETPEEYEKRMISKRSLIQKANKSDPDLKIFEPPTPPPPEPEKEPSPEPSFVPLQSNRLSQWMNPWKKPDQQDGCPVEIFAKPKFIRARHIPRRWRQNASESEDSTTTATTSEDESDSDEDDDEDIEDEEGQEVDEDQNKAGASMSSDDSGFDSGRAKFKGSIDSRDSPGNTLNPATNPAFALDFADLPEEVSQSSTYLSFQRSGRITPPATTIPRFRKYCVDDFNFLKVLGKGSFGKVLLAELKGTEYYYAIKCLKKDVVLEDDDVECTLIERKVLALGTKHPYLCHLLCTFQTESHLFFVMEYLNGGDLMFHIQAERRFSEARARFYGAEIVSGLKFLHNKGIVYRDLKLDNILLDFDGHVRIADFGMCKLQIFLDRMADTFCGTPDYMAPEIIKGQHYNQCVDWWSFGVLLYEMLLGQSPFSGSDEDELFWSICNEKPVIPRFLSAEAGSVLMQFLEKDGNKRLGNRFSPHGDIQDHAFFKPIDWPALEARQLEPPFKPNLQHPLDTQYFDKTFTLERAKLTPIESSILQSMDQTQFQGFSYTNPNATDK